MSRTSYISELNRACYYTIVAKQAITCVYCDCALNNKNISIDHVLPRSKYKGLSRDFSNFAPCCNVCNSSKSNKPLNKWLRHKGMDIKQVKSRIGKAKRKLTRVKVMALRETVSPLKNNCGGLTPYKHNLFSGLI